LAEIERRNKLQSDYETGIKSCIATLETYVAGLKAREELRGQLDTNIVDGVASSPLMEERQQFEMAKKSLKVSVMFHVKQKNITANQFSDCVTINPYQTLIYA
jgi:hypothetical protein